MGKSLSGLKFGRLTVLEESSIISDKKDSRYRLWTCRCDCGLIVDKPQHALINKKGRNPSCGCARTEASRKNGQSRIKQDLLPGMFFGKITVLSKLEEFTTAGHRLFLFHCGYCDGEFKNEKYGIIAKKVKSCGCLAKKLRQSLVDNKRKPKDLVGQRFGDLVVQKLATDKSKQGRPLWICECVCGQNVCMTNGRLRSGYRLNCGDRSKHQWGHWYPEMPTPMPEPVAQLIIKYQNLRMFKYKHNDSRIEDARRERLIRVCWILHYRKMNGENFSDLHERHYIIKSLRHVSKQIEYERSAERNGGILYNNDGIKIIGGAMTDATLLNYPVSESETQGTIILTKIEQSPVRPKKFRRC